MKSLKVQVWDFLCSGGYRSAKAAQETAVARRRPYRRLDGEIDYKRVFGDFSGFETEDVPGQVLVRFIGPGADETGALDGYARVLGNCGFRIGRDVDPKRAGREVIRVSARAEITNSPVLE